MLCSSLLVTLTENGTQVNSYLPNIQGRDISAQEMIHDKYSGKKIAHGLISHEMTNIYVQYIVNIWNIYSQYMFFVTYISYIWNIYLFYMLHILTIY